MSIMLVCRIPGLYGFASAPQMLYLWGLGHMPITGVPKSMPMPNDHTT
jgi:hypothetical protein